jgi:Ala-tRNA(Pro) deacylase
MTIATTLERYLRDCGIDYEVVEHARTLSSSRTAEVSHVAGDRLAKAVVLKSEGGFTMAVLPASCHLRLGELQDYLARPIGLATEKEVGQLFDDCELGAIPAVGIPYGMEMIVRRQPQRAARRLFRGRRPYEPDPRQRHGLSAADGGRAAWTVQPPQLITPRAVPAAAA